MRKTLVLAFGLALAGCVSTGSADQERVLRASTSLVTYQVGDGRPEIWQPDPAHRPAIIDALVTAGQRENVCFRAGREEACVLIGVGDSAHLVIESAAERHNVQINGILRMPMAHFSPDYQASNRGRFQVLAPEVYELVNVAIALTDYAEANPGLVVTTTDYYARVSAHFDSHRAHPFVQALSQRIQEDVFWCFKFKMNAYAFGFDESGEIVRSAIYDRTGFNGDPDNDLLPPLDLMRDFARATAFDVTPANSSIWS